MKKKINNGLQWGVQAYPWDLPAWQQTINPSHIIWASQKTNNTLWTIGAGTSSREVYVSSNLVNWTRIEDFPVPIRYAKACEFGGRIVVVGGENPSDQWDKYNKVWIYM